MLKQKILKDLKAAVEGLGFPAIDIVLSIPKNSSFGDYTTNIALQLAKQKSVVSYQSSDAIAKAILEKLGKPDYLEKAEVAGGGFINFYIKPVVLLQTLKEICNPSVSTDTKKGKVLVEFTDPNPFKEFHIGHLFSNSVGESLARLFEAQGFEVKRANYFGDVGMHVAKSIWGVQQKLQGGKLTLEDLEQKPLKERIELLGQAYASGAKAYEEDEVIREQIKKINLLVYIAAQQYMEETTKFQPQVDYKSRVEYSPDELTTVRQIFEKGRQWSLEYFETIYILLGTKFDYYYPESIVGEYGLKIVLSHLDDRIFEKSDGAIIFPGEKYGLHNRVFVNSLGLPTYEAKELGLAVKKQEDYQYDKSIVVTGNEINEYFKVLMMALSKIYPELAKKTVHVGHGMVRMLGGKISSRKGNVLTFEDIFEQVKSKVALLLKDVGSPKEKGELLNSVSVGAIKFAMLKHQPGADTIFDIEKSVALEGDSGPYLQYTYARANSILRNAQITGMASVLVQAPLEDEERQILQKVEYFAGTVEEAANSLHPNTVASYLIELAAIFNLFYQKHRIINAAEDKKQLRLALTCAVASILKQGLYLLGIEAPERM